MRVCLPSVAKFLTRFQTWSLPIATATPLTILLREIQSSITLLNARSVQMLRILLKGINSVD